MAKFKGLIKTCKVCGTEFKVSQCQSHVETCSRECGYRWRSANAVGKVRLTCAHCAGEFFEFPSHVSRRKFCSKTCMEASRATFERRSAAITGDRNPAWKGGVGVKSVSATGRVYTRSQAHVETEKCVRRKRAKDRATPAWADLDKVREIYRQCMETSKETGVKHHVDHIVPLTSRLVSGLHNEFNLQIIPAIDNLKKANRTWPNKP